jgi:ketosteroid isomerase-like protein
MEAKKDDMAELDEFGKRWAEAELARDLQWRDTEARVFGDCAVVVGVHDQEAAYRGRPNNGQFRATHILVREDSTWRLVGMHLSPIAAPPGAPQQQA